MSEKKCEMERRLHNVVTQRDSLSAALDEATDRIMMLEKTTREQESQVDNIVYLIGFSKFDRESNFICTIYYVCLPLFFNGLVSLLWVRID